MKQIDGFQGADHDLEINDLALIVPTDHVDAVEVNAVDFGFKFENGIGTAFDFTDVTEIVRPQYLERGLQIKQDDGLADLGRVDHRRMENGIVGQ